MADGKRAAPKGTAQLDPKAGKARPAPISVEQRLDAALFPHGYHCLHSCRMPGSRRTDVDHVVIGPSGVWVVAEKRLASSLSVTARGEVFTGRVPLTGELEKARDEARSVDRALGRAGTRPLLAIQGTTVPGGVLERDAVVLAELAHVTDVILRTPALLKPAEVDRLASAGRVVLAPERLTGGDRKPAPIKATAPDRIPDWVLDDGKPGEKSKKSKGKQTKPKRRLRRVVLALVVLVAAGAGAMAVLGGGDDAPPSEPVAGSAPAIGVRFECRNPGQGWSAVAAWSGVGDVWTVSWGTTADGPWEVAATFGSSTVRDGVVPSAPMFVRLDGQSGMGVVETATAPAEPC